MRTKLSTNDRIRTAIIGLSVIAAIVFVGWLAWVLASITSFGDQVQHAAAPVVAGPVVSSLAKKSTDLIPEAPAELPAGEDEAPVQTAPVVHEEAPAQPVSSSPWTGALNTVGIPQADQAIVLKLTMTGFEWNLSNCGCGFSVMALSSPEARFTHLNNYVNKHYGSWSAARDQAAQGSW